MPRAKPQPQERAPVAVFAALFALAVALRVVACLQAQAEPALAAPMLDSRYYLESGRAIAHERGFGPRPFFMNPGYVLLVAAVDRAFASPQPALIALQILLDGATCTLAALLAWRLFGRSAALVAGALLALNGAGIVAATRVLPETAAAFALTLLALRLTREREPWTRANLLAAGALLGALALLRSNALLLLPCLWLALIQAARGAGWRAAAARCGWLAAGTAALVAPVALRNALVGRDLVLLGSSGGVNFYLGNAPQSDGRFLSLRELELAPGRLADDPSGGRLEATTTAFAEERSGRRLAPSEVSRFWTRLALAEIARDPGRFAALELRKLFLLVNGFEIPQQLDGLRFLARHEPVLAGPASLAARLLWPLGVFGMLAIGAQGEAVRRRARILLWLGAGYALSVLLFFVTARHRLPLAPLVACFAGAGAAFLIGLWRGRAPRRLAWTALLAACLVLSNLNPALGQRFVGGAPARGWFAVDAGYDDLPMQHNNLAALLLERGEPARAEAELRAGLAANPRHALLLQNLARAREQQGDLAGAREALERAAVAAPDQAGPWNALAPLRLQAGDVAGALAALAEAERLEPGSLPAAYNRGILLLRIGRLDEAVALFTALRTRAPQDRQVALGLAEALLRARRPDAAAEVVQAELARRPDDVDALLLLAELHRSRGEIELARAALERALAASPRDPRAQRALRQLGATPPRAR